MTKCTYKNEDLPDYECNREAHPNSPHNLCILHEEMENKDPEETRQAFYKEIEEGKTDFTGCILPEIDLHNQTIEGDAVFTNSTIEGLAWFVGATIEGDASFSRSNIGSLTFKNTTFKNMKAQEMACRTAKRTQEKLGDRVEADYHFYREMEAKRKQKPWYKRYISEWPLQYIFGYGVHLGRIMVWWGLIVLLFFIWYAVGNGVTTDYSPVEYLYLSTLITANPGKEVYILALVTPIREFVIGIVNHLEKTYSLLYYLLKCAYFSVTTSATPGYGGYYPKSDFVALAIIQAILGTFIWAAFIATVARKYMRS